MSVLNQIQVSFRYLKKHYQSIITPLVPHRTWEITVPVLERTTFAQTGLILSLGPKLSTVTDNGTVNNGNAFRHSAAIQRRLHRMMIQSNVSLVGNEYYTVQFAGRSATTIERRIDDLVKFLIGLDRLLKHFL